MLDSSVVRRLFCNLDRKKANRPYVSSSLLASTMFLLVPHGPINNTLIISPRSWPPSPRGAGWPILNYTIYITSYVNITQQGQIGQSFRVRFGRCSDQCFDPAGAKYLTLFQLANLKQLSTRNINYPPLCANRLFGIWIVPMGWGEHRPGEMGFPSIPTEKTQILRCSATLDNKELRINPKRCSLQAGPVTLW